MARTAVGERATLLPAPAPPISDRHPSPPFWRFPRVALLVLILVNAATAAALVRVAQVSSELLTSVQHTPRVSFNVPTTALSASSRVSSDPSPAARVLIVYSNGTHLSKLAHAVERGVLQAVARPEQLRTRLVEHASFEADVVWADAVILGSHVVNANVEPKMAAFMSSWIFSADLSHKVGAAFVTGGGMSSGEELTMVNLLHSMLIFRMVIVGGERWTSAFGASAIVSEGPFQRRAPSASSDSGFPSICYPTSPDQIHDLFKDKAEGLGRRVASVASLLVSHASEM